MTPKVTVERLTGPDEQRAAMTEDVRRGLSAEPPSIPPVWFYDEAGSRLFDEITRLPEYYLTRAEKSILAQRAPEIASTAGAGTLVEIGSGTSEKTRLLLDAMAEAGTLTSIVLLDISEEVLVEAAELLAGRYGVAVRAVVADLRSDLGSVRIGEGKALWVFLGSTIGNFDPVERSGLFADFRRAMGPDDALLLGADLVKPAARLLAAYDDAAGVTAAFNLNVLSVLDRQLDADFDPEAFEHVATWNEEASRVEMRLRARADLTVYLAELDLKFSLSAGQEILTEISSKFRAGALRAELAEAGLDVAAWWTDAPGDFSLSLARPGR